jgi:hypothetical protein
MALLRRQNQHRANVLRVGPLGSPLADASLCRELRLGGGGAALSVNDFDYLAEGVVSRRKGQAPAESAEMICPGSRCNLAAL